MRIALCVGAGLALLAGPALAQRTERPEVRVGDRWQFVRYYSVPSTKPNLAWEINSVTATEISATENGEPLLMTPDLNVVDSPMNKQSNPKALSFPLEVGNRWRFASDWLFKPKGSKGEHRRRRGGGRTRKGGGTRGRVRGVQASLQRQGQRHVAHQQPIRRGDHDHVLVCCSGARHGEVRDSQPVPWRVHGGNGRVPTATIEAKMLGQVYFARTGFCDAHVAAHVHGKNWQKADIVRCVAECPLSAAKQTSRRGLVDVRL